MKEELIKFETAKLLIDKKFPYFSYVSMDFSDSFHGGVSTPVCTQSLAQRWLREVHGIHFVMIPTITSAWTYKLLTVLSERDNDVIMGIKSVSDVPPYKDVCGYDFKTYELALESALLEGLKLIEL